MDPLLLFRSSKVISSRRDLRLVIHGYSGGEVPSCLLSLADELRFRRSSSVELEVLTSNVFPSSYQNTSWLVPLLLLPGNHARHDVPAIRRRLNSEGNKITLLPFLGAWSSWWKLVKAAINVSLCPSLKPGLVHHPLPPGVSQRFLQALSLRMQLPLVSFDRWNLYTKTNPSNFPIPLALAPNKMTNQLTNDYNISPLLNHILIRRGLIDILEALP